MQFVPASKTRSAWRGLVLFFAALLTLGVLAPVSASAHGKTLLRVSDAWVEEGDYGYSYAHVKISLTHKVNRWVSVGYVTQEDTATKWVDYKPTWGRAKIKPMKKSTWIHVKVYGDTDIEDNEKFFVKLFHPRGAGIADRYGKVCIENDDHLPSLVVEKDRAVEGEKLLFRVVLSAPAPGPVTFNYKTFDLTAKAGEDYTAVDYGSATIPTGGKQVYLPVQTLADTALTADTGPEFMKVKVFHISGAEVTDSDALGIIVDPAP